MRDVCVYAVSTSTPAAQGAAQALLVAGLRAGRLPLLHSPSGHVGVHLAAAATWRPATVATVAAAASGPAHIPFPVLQCRELVQWYINIRCLVSTRGHQMQDFGAYNR
jgi:hypothetical protein